MSLRKEVHILNKRKRMYIYYDKVHIATVKNDDDKPITLEVLLMEPKSNIFHELNFKLKPGEAKPFAGHRGCVLGKIPESHRIIFKKIGELLKKAREKSGLSASHVVGKLGLNLLTLQKTEKGERRIYQSEIRLLCKLYKQDPEPMISQLILLEELEDNQ